MKQLILSLFLFAAVSATAQKNRDSLLKREKELAYADSVNTDFLMRLREIHNLLDSILHPHIYKRDTTIKQSTDADMGKTLHFKIIEYYTKKGKDTCTN